jgi:hypothetical protein
MPNWNLEKIYLEGVGNIGSIAHPRHLVREYKTKSEVKKAIVDSNPLVKLGADKRGAIRLQPKGEVKDREEFTKNFLNTLDEISLLIVDTISPGEPGSPSSKFPSYKVKDSGNNEFIITLGGGSLSNEGMKYERDILKNVEEYFDNPEEVVKPGFIEKLEDFLDVEFKNIDKGKSFERRVQRPLSDEGPDDKGDEISDITLVDSNDKKYFISIKNVGGKTISNAGAKGMFEVDDKEVKFANKERNKIGGKLLEAGGVDVDKAVKGLQDYIEKTPSLPGWEDKINTTDIADIDKLSNFLGSAFDYGYIYVKQKNRKDDLEIADLTDESNLYNFIGDIQSIEVKYPYFRNERKARKHISIILTTTKGVYSFDIRNAKGGTIPDQINLVKGKTSQEVKAAKSSIDKLETSNKTLSDILNKYD